MDKELFKQYQERLRGLSENLEEILEEVSSRKQDLEVSLFIAIKLEHKMEENFIRKEFEPLIDIQDKLKNLHYNITKPYEK